MGRMGQERYIKGLTALRALASELGWASAVLYALNRLLEAASGGRARIYPYALVAQPIGQSEHGVRDSPDTLVRVAMPGDALEVHFPRAPAINQMRWAAGSVCYVATVKQEFAGTIWVQRGAYVEDEVRCDYILGDATQSAWDFDVFVQPRYRFGRTMARMWKEVDRILNAEGVRWSFSRISLFNGASMKSHARLGAVRVGRLVFVALGPWQLTILDRWPMVHLSWQGRRRLRVVVLPPTRTN